MKKIFLLLILVLTFFSCTKKEKISEEKLLNYIPQDTLFFFKLKNLTSTYNQFKNSDFFTNLTQYKFFQEITQKIDDNQNKIDKFKQEFQKEFEFNPTVKNFFDMFGNDLLFSFKIEKDKFDFLFLTECSETNNNLIQKLDKNFFRLLKKNTDNKTIQKTEITEHSGIKIKSVKLRVQGIINPQYPNRDIRQDININYFIKDNLLFVSNSITRLYDIIDNKINSVNKNSEFIETFKKLDVTNQVIAYFKLKDFAEQIKQLPQLNDINNLNSNLYFWDIIKTTGISFNLKPNTVIKSYSVFNNETQHKELLKMYKKKNGTLKSASFIPINSLLFISTNLFDADVLYDSYDSYFKQYNPVISSQLNNMMKQIQNNINADLKKDLFQNLGNEISFALINPKYQPGNKNVLDSINFAFITKVKNKEKINLFLNKTLKSINGDNSIILNSEQYNQNNINVITNKKYPENNFAYSYKDDYMIFSSLNTLKKILDTSNSDKNKSLLQKKDNLDFSEILEKANSFSYFDFRQFIANVKEIVDNYWWFLDSEDKYYSKYAVPVLEMLSYIDGVAGYSKSSDSGIFSEMYIFINTPKNIAAKK